tara:strand:+ start:76 stop:258 length:183 start_codon:yes stop_codon:yes gene_type:complete
LNRKTKTRIEKNIEPKAPAIVLLGLIFVSLGPLKTFPNKKPPISEPTQHKTRINKTYFKE